MGDSEETQFISCRGMADQSCAPNVQGVQKLPNVFHARRRIVAIVWCFGFTMSAPGESEHAKVICELRREEVVDMRRIADSVQKQHRLSLAAPIQIMELH